jgi:hypothetical protein
MVERLEIFSCRFCGAEFAKKGEAENCEKSHLHINDMKLNMVTNPGDDTFCYDSRRIWPTFIRISCTTRSIDGAVYQLVGTRRKSRGPSTT